MTEQIKKEAEELVGIFRDVDMPSSCNYATLDKETAKQCAIICCDEILKIADKKKVINEMGESEFYHYTQLKQYIQTKM